MLGAIVGDIIGSVYEARPIRSKEFELFHRRARFTDDSVLTIAVARAILEDRDYRASLHELGRRYPDAGQEPTRVAMSLLCAHHSGRFDRSLDSHGATMLVSRSIESPHCATRSRRHRLLG